VQFFEVNSMGVKDLAERLEITPGGVTRIITSLENKGYVERRISLDDRRNINVLLTSQGKKLVKKMRRAAIDIHREIFDQIDPSERETVAAAIQTLLNALDSWLQEQARVLEES
jgi:DNA-binding MarR family transcriptional regulator